MVSVVVDDAGLTAVVDIFVRDVAVVVDISIFVLVVDDFVPGRVVIVDDVVAVWVDVFLAEAV